MPAAGCEAVIEQVPTAMSVIVPPLVTEQIAGVVVEYVTAWPEVLVATGAGAVAPYTVLGSAGKAIVLVAPVIEKLCVTGVAAA